MVQSNQLNTRITNYVPNNIGIGQQNDNDFLDNREDYLYQVDGTTDIHTPTDHSADNEDTEPDNNAHKRQRKVYVPTDASRKEMTKQRQAQMLKNQHEKERLNTQTLENTDNTDRKSRTRTKRPMTQLEDSGDNIDNTNSPRPQKSKGKVFHPDHIKSSKKNRKMPRARGNTIVPNDPPLDPDTPNEDPLIGDLIDTEEDSDYALGPDEIGFFFLKGEGNLPDLLGIEDEQLLAIQNDLHQRMKARDEARERAISNKLCELEKKHDFINTQYLKHFAQVSELLEPTAKDATARVKPADKMLRLPSLFDGEKPEKAKTHFERFNQYIKFQTKEGNIKDPIKEAIELFEHTLDKKVLIWLQQHKAEFQDLTTIKNIFLARYNPWRKTKRDQLQLWNNLSFDPQNTDIDEQIDLVLTLGNMLKQDEHAKMDKFI